MANGVLLATFGSHPMSAMRRAALLVSIAAAAWFAVLMAVIAWKVTRPRWLRGDPVPREAAVVIDPGLTDEHAWRIGRNPPGPLVNRWVDLEADVLDDGRLHVVRRLPRPRFEDVTELSLDLANKERPPRLLVRSWTRELASGTAWHVHDLEGTVRVSSARSPTEPAAAPLVVEYELRGLQSGSGQRLHGKFALDFPIGRK